MASQVKRNTPKEFRHLTRADKPLSVALLEALEDQIGMVIETGDYELWIGRLS